MEFVRYHEPAVVAFTVAGVAGRGNRLAGLRQPERGAATCDI